MNTRGQTDDGPKQSEESTREDGGELRTSVVDYIDWDPMQAEDVQGDEFSPAGILAVWAFC